MGGVYGPSCHLKQEQHAKLQTWKVTTTDVYFEVLDCVRCRCSRHGTATQPNQGRANFKCRFNIVCIDDQQESLLQDVLNALHTACHSSIKGTP